MPIREPLQPAPVLWTLSGVFYSVSVGLLMLFWLLFIRELGRDHNKVQGRRGSVSAGDSQPSSLSSSLSSSSPRAVQSGTLQPLVLSATDAFILRHFAWCCGDVALIDELESRVEAEPILAEIENVSWDDVTSHINFSPYVFFATYEIVSLGSIVLNATKVTPFRGESLEIDQQLILPIFQVTALQYITVVFVAFWILWFIISTWRTAASLRGLPYMAYRYRQVRDV